MLSTVRMIEHLWGKRPPQGPGPEAVPQQSFSRPLKDGERVVVIGGGIAGSSFVRQLLLLSKSRGIRPVIQMVNSTNCNYCGGLITDIALQTLRRLYRLDIPQELILKEIDSCVYINKNGNIKVQLDMPLVATLRTSRFGLDGFDDLLKDKITAGLAPDMTSAFTTIEPTIATKIDRSSDGTWRVVLSKKDANKQPIELQADVLVLACGFRSLQRPVLQSFQEITGFIPPKVMPASVTELDLSSARYNRIQDEMYIIDGIIPDAVVAFIPKGKEWLTLTALGKKLTLDDLDLIFNHPSVKDIIDLPDPRSCPRCHTICGASVHTSPARNFYGDNWVVIGDLTGYSRVFKDGYFGAFWGSRLAAAALVYHGASRQSWSRFYHKPLAGSFKHDNIAGTLLFNWNCMLSQLPWFNRLLINTALRERRQGPHGGFIHSCIRALATGELPYRILLPMFALGFLKYCLANPWAVIKGFPMLNDQQRKSST